MWFTEPQLPPSLAKNRRGRKRKNAGNFGYDADREKPEEDQTVSEEETKDTVSGKRINLLFVSIFSFFLGPHYLRRNLLIENVFNRKEGRHNQNKFRKIT